MKCKICKLEESNNEAFEEIQNAIRKKRKLSIIINDVNGRHGLNITASNASRHKAHTKAVKRKKAKKVSRLKPQNETVKPGSHFDLNHSPVAVSLDLNPKHIKFLFCYKANGYKNKEAAWIKAGFKDPKKVYEAMRLPELQRALNEIKAIDYIQAKITPNQVMAGIGKLAQAAELKHKMYDEKGELITNIREWPEELRFALSSIKKKVTISGSDESGPELHADYEFKFESSLSAHKELRKHFIDIGLHKIGEESRRSHTIAVAIMSKRKKENLSLVETMRLFERDKIPFPESLKLEVKDFDWELENRIKKAELNGKNALAIVNGQKPGGDDISTWSTKDLEQRLVEIDVVKKEALEAEKAKKEINFSDLSDEKLNRIIAESDNDDSLEHLSDEELEGIIDQC